MSKSIFLPSEASDQDLLKSTGRKVIESAELIKKEKDPDWVGNDKVRFRLFNDTQTRDREINVECLVTGDRYFSGGFIDKSAGQDEPSYMQLAEAIQDIGMSVQFDNSIDAKFIIRKIEKRNIKMIKSEPISSEDILRAMINRAE